MLTRPTRGLSCRARSQQGSRVGPKTAAGATCAPPGAVGGATPPSFPSLGPDTGESRRRPARMPGSRSADTQRRRRRVHWATRSGPPLLSPVPAGPSGPRDAHATPRSQTTLRRPRGVGEGPLKGPARLHSPARGGAGCHARGLALACGSSAREAAATAGKAKARRPRGPRRRGGAWTPVLRAGAGAGAAAGGGDSAERPSRLDSC